MKRSKKSHVASRYTGRHAEVDPLAPSDRVAGVLLSDGWHEVKPDSFTLSRRSWGISATWLELDTAVEIRCRVSAIQAVKLNNDDHVSVPNA